MWVLKSNLAAVDLPEPDVPRIIMLALFLLKAFMKYYDPTIGEDVLTMFSEMAQLTYQRFGISFETDFSHLSSTQYPTFLMLNTMNLDCGWIVVWPSK